MVASVDVGYSYTKNNYGKIFKSAMTTEDSAVCGAYKMHIDGNKYFVGCGKGSMDVDKFNGELSKVLLLTSLYLTGENEFYIVTGLPISQYKSQKENFKKAIMSYKKSTVNERTIYINDATIFPQAAGALYSQDIRNDCVIIDIGGRTTDIGLFEFINNKFNLIKYNTLYCGMEGLYSFIIKACNEKFQLSLENWQGESIIRNGLILDGEKQDLYFLQDIIDTYCEELCNELVLNFPIRTVRTYLCGGGSTTFYKTLKSYVPSMNILDDSQYANAKGFYIVGRSIYGK